MFSKHNRLFRTGAAAAALAVLFQPARCVAQSHALASPHRTILLTQPGHSLLDGARVVMPLNAHFQDYCWLSSTRLLLVWTDRNADYYQKGFDRLGTWTGWAEVVDTVTGHHTKLPGLTRDLRKAHGIPGQLCLSPGGAWLQWTIVSTGDQWPIPVAARMDGTGFQIWQQDKFSEGGWLNDHTWVEIGDRDSDSDKAPDRVVVRDMRTGTGYSVQKSSARGKSIAAQVYRTTGGTAMPGGTADWITLKMAHAPGSAGRQTEIPEWAGPNAGPIDRIYLEGNRSRTLLCGYRIGPGANVPAANQIRDAFYLCAARSSAATELGYLPVESTSEEGLGADYSGYQFAWLPGDRSISFVYKNKLYVKRVRQ